MTGQYGSLVGLRDFPSLELGVTQDASLDYCGWRLWRALVKTNDCHFVFFTKSVVSICSADKISHKLSGLRISVASSEIGNDNMFLVTSFALLTRLCTVDLGRLPPAAAQSKRGM